VVTLEQPPKGKHHHKNDHRRATTRVCPYGFIWVFKNEKSQKIIRKKVRGKRGEI